LIQEFVAEFTAGIIRQLVRGLYDYPVSDPVLSIVTPSADAIRIQPSGADRATIVKDLKHAPAWIGENFRRLAEPST
jgi:hypothetical protein